MSTTESVALSLHDALPILTAVAGVLGFGLGLVLALMRLSASRLISGVSWTFSRSEEHTSELQSRGHLVCRLLLVKKRCKRRTRILFSTSHMSQLYTVQ